MPRPGLIVALAFSFVLSSCSAQTTPERGAVQALDGGAPRNLIFFIADGCGPASFTMARDYAREVLGRDQVFDVLQTGSVITRASDARVTDSAASATAYACGIRTKNGRIGTDDAGDPVETIVEAAERAGYWTGLVSTARITHATPAAFSAHVPDRSAEAEIAVQQLGMGIEVLLGGGRDFFFPEGGGGKRGDGRNLVDEATAAGYAYVDDATKLEGAATVPLLGLFNASHVAYEIDRATGDNPSLAQMTAKALELLAAAPKGFFIMIEAGRIDHAAHPNDAAAHLHDLLAYEEAMRVALEFAEKDGKTLVVATSDHETGGLTVGRDGVYDWNPEALEPVRRSFEAMEPDVRAAVDAASTPGEAVEAVAAIAEEAGMGPLSSGEKGGIAAAVDAGWSAGNRSASVWNEVEDYLKGRISARAGLGWTTTGHTGVDVPLYARGPGSKAFLGRLDNLELGHRLAAALGLELSGKPPVGGGN